MRGRHRPAKPWSRARLSTRSPPTLRYSGRLVAESKSSWWVRTTDGVARRITPAGLLVGRSPHCDLLVRSPQASRRQALVYLGGDGPRLTVMGRGAVTLRTRAASEATAVGEDVELEDGSRIAIAELELEITREESEEEEAPTAVVWVLENEDGGLFSFTHSPFRVGGANDDDLRVEGWPPRALSLRAEDGRLRLEPSVDVLLDGEPARAGSVTPLRRGSELSLEGRRVRIVTGGELTTGSTAALGSGHHLPPRVRLEFLPRGGRLHVTLGEKEHSVYLSDRRCDFVAVLLRPPTPLTAGELVPDELVWTRVWGKQPSGRKTLHVLLHRVRKDLDRVGLVGSALLQRAEGGGATRFALPDGVHPELD